MEDEIFKKLKDLIARIDLELADPELAETVRGKILDKIARRVEDSENRLLLSFNDYESSKNDFKQDADNENYTQERISLNGNFFIKSTDRFMQEAILIINIISEGFAEELESIKTEQAFNELSEHVGESPNINNEEKSEEETSIPKNPFEEMLSDDEEEDEENEDISEGQ